MFNSKQAKKFAFELNMVRRDHKGNPVGRAILATDSPAKLSWFFDSNGGEGDTSKKSGIVRLPL